MGAVILSAALFVSALSGCARTQNVSSAPEAVSRQPVSSAVPSSGREASSFAGLKKNDAVAITGANHNFQLRGMEFKGADTGWMIQNRYNSDSNDPHSQLMMTHDGGENWNPVGDQSLVLDAVHFSNDQVGWAVSQKTVRPAAADVSQQVQYSILRTEDGGKSWSVRWKSKTEGESAPSLSFPGGSNGYALAGDSMLRTSDSGKQWSPVAFGQKDFIPVQMYFTDARTGWAAGVSAKRDVLSILHTVDGGKSWVLQLRKKYSDGQVGCSGVDFLNPKEGWFLTTDLSTMAGQLYHTGDGGAVWSPVGSVASCRPTPGRIRFVSSQTGWLPLDVGAGPITGGLAVTRDGGRSFQVQGDTAKGVPETTRKIQSARQVCFVSAQRGWAVGTDLNRGDYLLRTDDGGSNWEQIYPKTEPTVDFSFVNSGAGFGLGKLSDPNALLKTTDGGENWETVSSFTGTYQAEKLSFVSAEEGWVLALPVASDGGAANKWAVLHTADGGVTWKQVCGDLAFSEAPDCFRFFDGKNGAFIVRNRLYRTSNGGKTWKSSAYSFGDSVMSDQVEFGCLSGDQTEWKNPFSALKGSGGIAAALLPGGKGMVLTETSSGGSPGRYELLTTADGGNTWSPHLFPNGLGPDTFESLQDQCPMQFTDDLHGWILTSHGVLATVDGGCSWAFR